MSILDMWGFEWGSDNIQADYEGITFKVQSFLYDNSETTPVGSSSFYLRSLNNGTSEGLVTPQSLPSGSEFWLHWLWQTEAFTTSSDSQFVEWSQGVTRIGAVRLNDNTGLIEIDIPGTGTFTATSPKAILGTRRWRRIHVHVDLQNTATGFVRVYFDGDLSAPVYSIATTNTNPSSLTFNAITFSLDSASAYIDDLVLMDPLDATGVTDPEEIAYVTISGKSPDGDGNYTAWTAGGSPGGASDYQYIDEVPPLNSDYIQATATGQASTFTFEAANSENSIIAVKWKGRFLRSDTVAGANMNIRQRDVSAATDYDTSDIAVPGDGFIFQTFDQKPGGGSWTVSDFDDTEFGVVSKA